ncbi:MAG: hypothetical protein WA151_05465 [Desulfatirhabdiaceae bacterium]
MKKYPIIIICILSILACTATSFAESIELTLVQKSDTFVNNFPSSTAPYGATIVWDGEVQYQGTKIGIYTGKSLESYTGLFDAIVEYEIKIPNPNSTILNFVSIKSIGAFMNPNKVGMVQATSPDFKGLFGASVIIDGNKITISW